MKTGECPGVGRSHKGGAGGVLSASALLPLPPASHQIFSAVLWSLL